VEGKAISRFNALKHGILRESVTDYEKSDYKLIYDELVQEFSPNTTTGFMLIDMLTSDYVKLIRINKAEAEFFSSRINPHIEKKMYEKILDDMNMVTVREGSIPKIIPDDVAKLDLYSRYETSVRNRIVKYLGLLQNLHSF
jgi:hypothetical protein